MFKPTTSQKDKDQQKDQRSSLNTESTAGPSKEGPIHKTYCDENNSRAVHSPNVSVKESAWKPDTSDESEFQKFGGMLSESIRDFKNTLAEKCDLLEQTLTQPDVWNADDEECDVLSDSHHTTENEGGNTTADESNRPKKKARSNSGSGETTSKQKVLINSIADKIQIQEKVDSGIDEQLSQMINHLMFKTEKPDEEKLIRRNWVL